MKPVLLILGWSLGWFFVAAVVFVVPVALLFPFLEPGGLAAVPRFMSFGVVVGAHLWLAHWILTIPLMWVLGAIWEAASRFAPTTVGTRRGLLVGCFALALILGAVNLYAWWPGTVAYRPLFQVAAAGLLTFLADWAGLALPRIRVDELRPAGMAA